MTDLLSIQTALCFVFVHVVSNQQLTGISDCLHHYQLLTCLALFAAFADFSCQVVYPSEYAYKRNSVFRSERSSANCRQYESGLATYVFTEQYTHCDGTQLRLNDSDFGSEQYSSSDYYVWNAQIAGTSGHQLLFIFPTRVNLTTITLHYRSGNGRGLSKLRFLAVPDDFDIWDAPTGGYIEVAAVPPGGEPAGRRNVSVDLYFNTRKVLLYKYSNSYAFAVSEVEFCSCNGKSNNYY